ncbi:unnamed protein product [Boreogadus saida]
MVAVIVGSRKLGVNPDNLATPIAASLGDLISSFLFHHRDLWFLPPCGWPLLPAPHTPLGLRHPMLPTNQRGVGGNLVAIQASRIAAYLHPCSAPGTLPPDMARNRPDPCTTFCSEGASAIATRHTVSPDS